MTDEDETSDFDLPIDREALVRAAERGELPGALLPLVRVDRKHLADTLVTLHEGASVDVLEAFSAAALGDVEQHDFFFLMMLFAEMLPKIDADQAIVMTLTAGLVDRAGENGAAGTPYSAFRAWCAHDDTRPISVLAAIESAPQARGRFTQLALEAGAMQDPTRYVAEALRLVDHDEPPVHLGALSALGTADLTEQPGLEEVVLAALRRQIDGSADPAVVTNALGALFERCLAAGERRLSTLRQVVQRRPDTPSPLEQQVYARALATHGATLPSELLDALLYRLRRLDRQYGGIIQYLDTALSQYRDAIGIERTSRELVAMVRDSDGAIGLDDFRSLRYTLRSDGANGLQRRLLFDALHEGSLRAGHEIGSLFTEINEERSTASLDVASLGLTDQEIVTLCRRATVVLALAPRATLDLLLDALDAVKKDAAAEIGELLFEPVGLSYPDTVVRELKEREKRRTPSARSTVALVARRLNAYLEGIDSSRKVVELHPSALERRAVREREFRTMRDTQARGYEQSFFAQFATRVDILYGNAVTTYTPTGNADHPATRQEMGFSSMSVSMEMPRLRSLDPTERLLAIRRFAEE